MWRRFRLGTRHPHDYRLQYDAQVERLMKHANPFAHWAERANWMIDLAEWIRRKPTVSLRDGRTWKKMKQQRILFLLDWLDAHRDVRRVVQATLQKTLREAIGPELFCATGLPGEPAFFSELLEGIVKYVLPVSPAQSDLSTLFASLFPEPVDADWLLAMDGKTLSRLWRLCADDAITHAYRQQIDEALLYLVTAIVAVGVSPAFRLRLDPKVPLQATPFMALRRELEKYLMAAAHDEVALRSVRMLVAVCQAQTDRIYAHLDEFGVSVGLVYHVERMRAQLARMARLIDLREASESAPGIGAAQQLMADLIDSLHHRTSVKGLIRRSFSLHARKMVERHAHHGEHSLARDRTEYRAVLKGACVGGIIAALAVLGQSTLSGLGLAHFFEGAFVSLNFAVSFLVIAALGGVLAAKQPAVAAPRLAAQMGALDTADGLRALMAEIASLLRAQAAGVAGNIVAVIPTMLALSAAVFALSGGAIMPSARAQTNLQALSVVGPSPLWAAFTGVLLWLGALAAGFADNWFALRQVRESLAHHRRIVLTLGVVRAERFALWLERHVAAIAGNLSLAVLLGMVPVLAQFFGAPLDVRHVTLSAAALAASVGSLGGQALASAEFWLATGGIAVTGLLNVGVAFACALALALRARGVPAKVRRLVVRTVLQHLRVSPRTFLLAPRQGTAIAPISSPSGNIQAEQRRKSGKNR